MILTAVLMETHGSQNTQSVAVRFHAALGEKPKIELALV